MKNFLFFFIIPLSVIAQNKSFNMDYFNKLNDKERSIDIRKKEMFIKNVLKFFNVLNYYNLNKSSIFLQLKIYCQLVISLKVNLSIVFLKKHVRDLKFLKYYLLDMF